MRQDRATAYQGNEKDLEFWEHGPKRYPINIASGQLERYPTRILAQEKLKRRLSSDRQGCLNAQGYPHSETCLMRARQHFWFSTTDSDKKENGSMCVGCYAMSVMTLVSPVNEAPQPVNVPVLSQPAVQTQRQQEFTPDEVQASIASVLRRLPTTSNAQPLRDAFIQMQAKLVGVNDQEQVYEIVNEHMLSLSDQVLSAPNPVELLQLLHDAQEEPSQPQASSLLNSKGDRWGWLS